MKILFLSNRGLLPIKDGHTRRSANILKGLAENNQIYFLSFFENEEEISDENIRFYQQICQQVEFYPAPPKNFSLGMILRLLRSLISFDPYTIWRHYSKNFQKRLNEIINQNQFDVIHCDILPLCYTIRGRKDVFRSVTDHDVSYVKCFRIQKKCRNIILKAFYLIEAWKLKRLERKIFMQVNLGIVVSTSDKIILQQLCPEGDFIVVENGVAMNIFAPSDDPEEKNRLLWVGGFDNYPNRQSIKYLIEKIYPLVKQKIQSVSIDIVGGGVRKDLKKLAEKDSSIHLCGYADDPLPYINRAQVFVAPILSGGGTKLKVLEAMAAGKAIVCTSVGAEGIDGLHGKHFLIANDEKSFANAITTILRDESLRKSLGFKARQCVKEKYDYTAICKKLNEKYLCVARAIDK